MNLNNVSWSVKKSNKKKNNCNTLPILKTIYIGGVRQKYGDIFPPKRKERKKFSFRRSYVKFLWWCFDCLIVAWLLRRKKRKLFGKHSKEKKPIQAFFLIEYNNVELRILFWKYNTFYSLIKRTIFTEQTFENNSITRVNNYHVDIPW